MVYLGLYGFAWTDYDFEVTPAYDALAAGHVWRFFQLAPEYGGSLELRSPFALLPALWGGSEQSRFQIVSIPCLVAAALLAVWLFARLRELGASLLARWVTLGLCAANPITMYACIVGHPEELLGAVLCVAAVLAAQRGRVVWAGVLLGLAIVNKEWALLAVGPVLVALPAGRWRALVIAGGIAAVFYAPLIAAQVSAHSAGATLSVRTTGGIFQPWEVWWFLGSTGHIVKNSDGQILVGFRTAPGWIQQLSHPLIIALAAPLTLLAARRGRKRGGTDALLLLVTLLLLRCMLDPWDNVYYPLPFLIALLTWESLRFRQPPLLALVATMATWADFQQLANRLSPDALAAIFALMTVPALALLLRELYSPGRRAAGGTLSVARYQLAGD